MLRKKKKRKIGLPPETFIYTGDKHVEEPIVHLLQYNADTILDRQLTSKDIINGTYDKKGESDNEVTWYDVRGLDNVHVIEQIGQHFHVHPLALEDVLNTQQRPKWEDYQNGIFLVIRALHYNEAETAIVSEQISFYLGKEFLLTFQEHSDDTFCNVRDRLNKSLGKIRHKGADYLTYTLLDYIVDNYFVLLDKTEDTIDTLETQILVHFQSAARNDIYQLKRQLSDIRRAVLPLREVIGRFTRDEGNYLDASNTIYIRDLYDHITQIIEIIENQRDMVNGLDGLFNTEQSNRTNHVMRVLTIVSAIFIPLTFIVGVYGMNFDNMPELHYNSGYYWVWGLMILVVIGQLIYFKMKNWL
jgi:magnesium transporter